MRRDERSINQTKVHDTSMSQSYVLKKTKTKNKQKKFSFSLIRLIKSDRPFLRKFVFDVCLFCCIFVSRLISWILKNFAVSLLLCGISRRWVDNSFDHNSSSADIRYINSEITVNLTGEQNIYFGLCFLFAYRAYQISRNHIFLCVSSCVLVSAIVHI